MTRRRWAIILIVLGVYAALVIASHALARPSDRPADTPSQAVTTAIFDRDGVLDGGAAAVAFHRWRPTQEVVGEPVLLLHGSPGGLDNFRSRGGLADQIAATGREVIAFDLPGFGRSTLHVPDLSTRAHARYALAALTELDIERAHVVGWSMGGGVALDMAEIAPDRVASVTLLGAIATQETEGSGSYLFEHAKYGLGLAAFWALQNLTPHFGAVDIGREQTAWLHNFFDTDQRRYRSILETTDTPILIVHGRRDFLVYDWAAERHHELAPRSSLVMTPYSHFFPFSATQSEHVATILAPFIERHDDPSAVAIGERVDLAPVGDRGWWGWFTSLVRVAPWWALLVVIVVVGRWRFDATAGLCVLLAIDLSLDGGLMAFALLVASLTRSRMWWERAGVVRWAARVVWPVLIALALGPAKATAVMSGWHREIDAISAIPAWVVITATLAVGRRLCTRVARQRLLAGSRRIASHEWWPSWALYAPVVPVMARAAWRHGGPLVWTCSNPGVEPGGGVIGERKSEILEGFDQTDPRVLASMVLRRTGDLEDDVRTADTLIRAEVIGGYPCIVKPESGYRGVGVRVVQGIDDLRATLRVAHRDLCAQRYHAGPHEFGALWAREVSTIGHEDAAPGPHGRVIAVTRKTFPVVVGDGRRTLRALILRDPRYRVQARMFFERRRERLDEVIPRGERGTLSATGNHAQGSMFSDGADLLTPDLEASIDEVMRAWRGPNGEPFDFGRFDARYADEEELRAGRGFAIIELNGVTSEPTNMYDPSKPPTWAWRLLAMQWRAMFEIGARRRSLGRKPMTFGEIVRGVASDQNVE